MTHAEVNVKSCNSAGKDSLNLCKRRRRDPRILAGRHICRCLEPQQLQLTVQTASPRYERPRASRPVRPIFGVCCDLQAQRLPLCTPAEGTMLHGLATAAALLPQLLRAGAQRMACITPIGRDRYSYSLRWLEELHVCPRTTSTSTFINIQ